MLDSFLSGLTCLPPSLADGADGAGGGRGLRDLLAAAPCHPPVGRVRGLPADARFLPVPRHGALPGLQQLLGEPDHLRLPVRELPEGLPPGVHLPRAGRVPPQRRQGDQEPRRHPALHQLHPRVKSDTGSPRRGRVCVAQPREDTGARQGCTRHLNNSSYRLL